MWDNLKNRFSTFQDKFLYPQQVDALDFIKESKAKINILCAPTGSGKSIIGMIAGLHHKGDDRFCYLCSSKILQDQIRHEFPEVEVMKGRANFPCNEYHGLTAADCPLMYNKKHKAICIKENGCPYEQHKSKVLASPIQVLNYWYFLAEVNYVGRFISQGKYPIIICDEADTIEGVLSNFINLRIGPRIIDKLDLSPPQFKTTKARDGIASWLRFARTAKERVEGRIVEIDKELEGL